MAELIKKLETNLKEQAILYRKLVELEEQKQKALVGNNLQELDRVTAEEEQLLLEVTRLEQERLLWAEQVGQRLNRKPEELTLSELVESYPELKDVQGELDEVLSRIRELHRVNTELLEQALKIVNLTLGLMTQEEKPTYNPQQKNTANRTFSFLDKSI